jgi:hypothetical protein
MASGISVGSLPRGADVLGQLRRRYCCGAVELCVGNRVQEDNVLRTVGTSRELASIRQLHFRLRTSRL